MGGDTHTHTHQPKMSSWDSAFLLHANKEKLNHGRTSVLCGCCILSCLPWFPLLTAGDCDCDTKTLCLLQRTRPGLCLCSNRKRDVQRLLGSGRAGSGGRAHIRHERTWVPFQHQLSSLPRPSTMGPESHTMSHRTIRLVPPTEHC